MILARHLLCSAAVATLLALPAAAQQPAQGTTEAAPPAPAATPAREVTAETVVATVGGEEITLGQMIVMRARLPEQYQQLPDEMLFSGILDQIIQQVALGKSSDVTLSRGSQIALENERRALIAGEALTEISEGAVTDEALQKLYDERYASAPATQEYNAAHILVATEDEAKALKTEIEGGADFTELAKTRSTGPSGPNGGDLGWFSEGMMVEPFEKAVLAMKAGDVSDPVQTQFGWHIIKLNEVRQKEAPALDAVKAELTEEIQRQAIEAAVQAATENAEVTRDIEGIDPAVLRNLEMVTGK